MYCKTVDTPLPCPLLHRLTSPRVHLLVGPAVEAFGFERIIFGSAPSQTSRAPSSASDWYEIARESFAELGVDQDGVDAVFCGNAKRVYATSG